MKKFHLGLLTVLIVTIFCMCSFAHASAPSPSADMIPDYTILVNKDHMLPENWFKSIHLVTVEDFEGGHPHQVERETLEKFYELREALLQEGITIELDSCYRSIEDQQDIWDRFTEEYGEEYVKKYVAVPGYSEHHTGLAIDICLVKDGVTIDENDDMIAEKEIFAVIHSKLADYGFILRYPEGKEDITGYSYEPWHFRYVGYAEFAHMIMDNGITLEEYYDGILE